MPNRSHFLLMIVILFACGRWKANAQAPGTGAISGSVVDSDGLPIEGASVTAAQEATHSARVLTTSAAGEFIFSLLTPASYTITVQAPGFSRSQLGSVGVTVGEVRTIQLRMMPETVRQSVDVSANSLPLVQTE